MKHSKILIVEDEAILAERLEEAVLDCGFEVAGPVSTVDQALHLISREPIRGAILDISLGFEEKSYAVADALKERSIPFLFMTGFLQWDFPDQFKGTIILQKPFDLPILIPTLERMLAEGSPRGIA